MIHQICVESSDFVQSLRDASIYAGKNESGNGTNLVILTVLPKLKKLSVTACDGLGYYERRLNLEHCRKQPRPTLPGREMRLGIAQPDVSMLIKFIPARLQGKIRLEVDDEQIANDSFTVRLFLPNGISTSFFSKVQIEIPDLSSIRAQAEKGKKKNLILNSLHIPVREMLRAGRVFPGKGAFAQIFTTTGLNRGIMALLECKTDASDISVIFMLSQETNI